MEATAKLIKHYFPRIEFIKVLGQREGIAPKPAPMIVDDILSAASVCRKDVLYVGDSGIDMQASYNSGITACGVTWGFRPRSGLEACHPQIIVDRPETISRYS